MVLSKADIINGKFQTQEVFSKVFDDNILIRKLTDGEYSESEVMRNDIGVQSMKVEFEDNGSVKSKGIREKLQRKQKKSQAMKRKGMDMKIDNAKIEESHFNADVKVVKYGMSVNEEYTEDEVKQFPVGAVEEIAELILDFSGLLDQEETDKETEDFREE